MIEWYLKTFGDVLLYETLVIPFIFIFLYVSLFSYEIFQISTETVCSFMLENVKRLLKLYKETV